MSDFLLYARKALKVILDEIEIQRGEIPKMASVISSDYWFSSSFFDTIISNIFSWFIHFPIYLYDF